MLESENLSRGHLMTIEENASILFSNLSLPGGRDSRRWKLIGLDAARKAEKLSPTKSAQGVQLKIINLSSNLEARRAVARLFILLRKNPHVGDALWPLAERWNEVVTVEVRDARGNQKVIKRIVPPNDGSRYCLDLATGKPKPLKAGGFENPDELLEYYGRMSREWPHRDNFEVTQNEQTVGALSFGFHDKEKPRERERQYWLGREATGEGVMTEALKRLDEIAGRWYPDADVQVSVIEEHLGPSRGASRSSGSTLQEWSVDPVPHPWLLHRAQRNNTVELNLKYAKEIPALEPSEIIKILQRTAAVSRERVAKMTRSADAMLAETPLTL